MSKNSGNSFFTFLFGVFAGSVLGLLFAPEKGSHTRDRLSFLLDKYKKSINKHNKNVIQEMNTTKNEKNIQYSCQIYLHQLIIH